MLVGFLKKTGEKLGAKQLIDMFIFLKIELKFFAILPHRDLSIFELPLISL